MLFLDGIHTRLEPRELDAFQAWVRELRDQARVVVCVASKQDPSEQSEGKGIGVFAQAILQSTDEKARGVLHPSLYDFKTVFVNGVEELRPNTSLQKRRRVLAADHR